ncbi:hypothetical protein [Arthrobacter sp. UYEF36]|uniref:hypothetical protein n=1 Tax=Arthrobacter sp. UYEF36 TaxID=1756366 RepID=UPI0033967AAE
MTAERLHLRRGKAAGLTLLTLAVLLSGCTTAAPAQPGATTGTPTQTTVSSPASAPSAPAGPASNALTGSAPYQALTAEQQQKISVLEAMDQSTFEQQSRDDQLAYGAFLREVYREDAIGGEAGNAPKATMAAAKKVSRTSTGAEIIDDELLKEATARRSVEPDGADEGAGTTPAATGSNYAKMAPSRVSPVFPAAYAEVSAPSAPIQETVFSGLSDPQQMLIVDESNNFIPYDGSWEQLEFKVLELQNTETQASNQFYFAYTPFTDIRGAKDGVWILMFNAQEEQEKWIPDLSVID